MQVVQEILFEYFISFEGVLWKNGFVEQLKRGSDVKTGDDVDVKIIAVKAFSHPSFKV